MSTNSSKYNHFIFMHSSRVASHRWRRQDRCHNTAPTLVTYVVHMQLIESPPSLMHQTSFKTAPLHFTNSIKTSLQSFYNWISPMTQYVKPIFDKRSARFTVFKVIKISFRSHCTVTVNIFSFLDGDKFFLTLLCLSL